MTHLSVAFIFFLKFRCHNPEQGAFEKRNIAQATLSSSADGLGKTVGYLMKHSIYKLVTQV